MKTLDSFLCNFGFTFPLGAYALSYWETIDHVFRTGGLMFGCFVGIVTFILQLKKLFKKNKE